MSAKQVFGAVLTVVGVALIATGIGAPLGTIALGAGLGTISVASIVGMGLLLTSSLLLGPAIPELPNSLANGGRDRLYANLDPTTPRKIVFGETAAATDVRYQAYTGTDQEYYEQIVAVASHAVEGIDENWIDNEVAWTNAGGVQGRFVGYLTVNARTQGWSDNGIAIDATWTADCRLTGCAYVRLKYKLIGPDEETASPFQGGVSNRLTIRVRGAKVYDPRLDSTVTGGSGTQTASGRSTWVWDDDASRNPALQLLWYLLGWSPRFENTKLSLGMGIPPARIDLESFLAAANICDEPVSLAAGGTEPRYRADGVLSEGDDRRAVVDALCGAMNGTLRDHGGKIALQILYDDLASVVADFDETDILGDEEWNQTPPLTEYFNIYRGSYTDASDNALYQPSDYPAQSVDSPDGIDRIATFDQPLVQSVTQAQRLAKLRLMRNQYQGSYSAVFGKRAWQVSIGDVVRMSHSKLSWVDKLFRVASQSISRTGETRLTLVEEHPDIYAWSTADEGTPITAGTPPVADPGNNPLLPQPNTSLILQNSYAVGLRVTATDAGATASIILDGGSAGADFTIRYMTSPPDDVIVPDGSITGLAFGTKYYPYADVSELGDAAPTYGAATTYAAAINSETNPLRIFLGRSITTPADGAPDTTGGGSGGGPGGGFDDGGGLVSYP